MKISALILVLHRSHFHQAHMLNYTRNDHFKTELISSSNTRKKKKKTEYTDKSALAVALKHLML